jgi:hypothetical protein
MGERDEAPGAPPTLKRAAIRGVKLNSLAAATTATVVILRWCLDEAARAYVRNQQRVRMCCAGEPRPELGRKNSPPWLVERV